MRMTEFQQGGNCQGGFFSDCLYLVLKHSCKSMLEVVESC